MKDDFDQLDKKAREAALDPLRSFIVQAPAGSGKTQLLIQRYLKLLSVVQRPEAILAVTFTRKAQQEMRQRIISQLQKAKGEKPTEEHEIKTWLLAKESLKRCEQLRWNLLENPNRLKIMTLDAFCHHLVRRLPFLSQLGYDPEISEDPKAIYVKAIQAFLLDVQRKESFLPALKKLLQHLDNSREKLIELLIKLLQKRDQWLKYIYPISKNSEQGLSILEEGLKNIVLGSLEKISNALSLQEKRYLLQEAQRSGEFVFRESADKPLARMREWQNFPQVKIEDVAKWQLLKKWLLTEKKEIRKRFTKNEGFPVACTQKDKKVATLRKTEFEKFLNQLQDSVFIEGLKSVEILPEGFTQQERIILTHIFELLPLLVAHVKVRFKEEGKVDFIEMNEAALQALGSDDDVTDLGLSLDSQIHHILLDEFQDTSINQFLLLEKLVTSWSGQHDKSLFLVGDPQQSIYGFRGAEVGLFLKVVQNGIQSIPLTFLQLRKNFRSSPSLIGWVNKLFVDLFPVKSNITLGAVPYSASLSALKENINTEIQTLFFTHKDEEHRIITDIITQRLQAGDKKIAILARTKDHFHRLIPWLRLWNIPFKATEILNLKHSLLIQDLRALLAATCDLSNRVAWLSILRAPWCGLSIEDLWLIAHADEQPIIWDQLKNDAIIQTLTEEGQVNVLRLVKTLNFWFSQKRRTDLSRALRSLWFTLGGNCCYSKEELPQAKLFFDVLYQHCQGGLLKNFEQFNEKIESLFCSTEFSPQNQDAEVELMTIHKAKGLEFDTVIVPSLEKTTKNMDPELLLWHELAHDNGTELLIAPVKEAGVSENTLYKYVQSILLEKNAFESQRLFYVACTRAKKNLFLTATVSFDIQDNIKKPLHNSFLSYISSVETQVEFRKPQNINFTSAPAIRLSRDWEPPRVYPELLPLINPTLPSLNRPIYAKTFESHIGILIHAILQNIAEEGLHKWNSSQLSKAQLAWRSWLTMQGITGSQLEQGLSFVMSAIQQTLNSPRGRWILSSHVQGKSEFRLIEKQHPKDQIFIIDRTFLDDNIRWIIDYKVVFNPLTTLKIEDYLPQLFYYAKLMAHRENFPIRCGLYFPFTDDWYETAVESIPA
ncbi:MAG TPA: UvrD-helicase domain-containing protein [Gammaproteobacteria bacterium]|nr:UvrD-helicase domain-containing protein [Gammaproteobacteria bacterium]